MPRRVRRDAADAILSIPQLEAAALRDPQYYEGPENADVEGSLRERRIGEHRSQSEAADNKSDCDQNDQGEEQVPHKGVNQDAAQIYVPWHAHRLHPSRLM